MFELLLVVALTAGVAVGAVKVARDWQEREENIRLAKQIMTVHEAASTYVQMNFSDIWQTGFGESGEDPRSPTFPGLCCVGASIELPLDEKAPNPRYLKEAGGGFPADFPSTTFMGHGITVFLRDAGITGGKRTVEIFTVTFVDGAMPNAKILDEIRAIEISRIIGPRAGVLPERLDMVISGAVETVTSVYGSWAAGEDDLAALFTAGGYASMLSPPASGGSRAGSFLVIYEPVSFREEINEDVLYKISIPGRPELNRMEANLDMNNRTISGVDYLIADNVQVAGDVGLIETDRQSGAPSGASSAFVIGGHLRIESAESHISATTRYTNPADAVTDPVTGAVIDDHCKLRGGWRDGGVGNSAVDPLAVGPCNVEGGVLTSAGNVVADRLEANGAALSAGTISTPGAIIVSGNIAALSGTFLSMAGVNNVLTNSYQSNLVAGQPGSGSIVANTASANTVNARNVQATNLRTSTVQLVGGSLQAGTLSANAAQATFASATTATIGGSIGALVACTAVVSILNIPASIVAAYGITQWSCMPGTSITAP